MPDSKTWVQTHDLWNISEAYRRGFEISKNFTSVENKLNPLRISYTCNLKEYYSVPHSLPNPAFLFTTNEDIAKKFEADLPHCVRNVKDKNVLLFKFCCNIFICVRIIKEIPGSVASGTPCILEYICDARTHELQNWTQMLHFGQ